MFRTFSQLNTGQKDAMTTITNWFSKNMQTSTEILWDFFNNFFAFSPPSCSPLLEAYLRVSSNLFFLLQLALPIEALWRYIDLRRKLTRQHAESGLLTPLYLHPAEKHEKIYCNVMTFGDGYRTDIKTKMHFFFKVLTLIWWLGMKLDCANVTVSHQLCTAVRTLSARIVRLPWTHHRQRGQQPNWLWFRSRPATIHIFYLFPVLKHPPPPLVRVAKL